MSLNPIPSNGKKLWIYYNECFGPDGEFLEKAQCVLCSKYYIYKSCDNDGSLWRHLKNAHNIDRQYRDPNVKIKRKSHHDLPIPSQPERELDVEVHTKVTDNTNVPIYRYFTLYQSGRVKCRVCMSASLPTQLLPNHAANMKVHLKTHPRAYRLYELEKEFGICGPQYDEREHVPKIQSASNILNQDPDGKYHCQICQKTMSGGITEMQNHLKEKHPGISKHEIGQDSIYMEVIYVGDKDKQRPITKFNLTSVKKSKFCKSLGNEDLDAFGLYVTSLLRNMPQVDCTKIQQMILNNIIEAKLKVGDKKSKNQDTNLTETIETVTVAEDDDNIMTDASENMEDVADNILTYVEDNAEEVAVIPEPALVAGTSVSKRYKYAMTEDILELS